MQSTNGPSRWGAERDAERNVLNRAEDDSTRLSEESVADALRVESRQGRGHRTRLVVQVEGQPEQHGPRRPVIRAVALRGTAPEGCGELGVGPARILASGQLAC